MQAAMAGYLHRNMLLATCNQRLVRLRLMTIAQFPRPLKKPLRTLVHPLSYLTPPAHEIFIPILVLHFTDNKFGRCVFGCPLTFELLTHIQPLFDHLNELQCKLLPIPFNPGVTFRFLLRSSTRGVIQKDRQHQPATCAAGAGRGLSRDWFGGR
jgi:hypothetical protein